MLAAAVHTPSAAPAPAQAQHSAAAASQPAQAKASNRRDDTSTASTSGDDTDWQVRIHLLSRACWLAACSSVHMPAGAAARRHRGGEQSTQRLRRVRAQAQGEVAAGLANADDSVLDHYQLC